MVLTGISIKCVKDKPQIEEKEATQDDTLESNVDKSDFNKENIEGREVQKEKKTNEPVNSLQDKKKKTVSSKHSIISKNRAPKELISQLPEWLSSCVTDVPYLKLQDKPVGFEDLKTVSDPITLFSAGPTVGIHMRLRVNHLPIDSSYDRTRDINEYAQEDMRISSKHPFILHIIAWQPATNDTLWILTSERYPRIEHRGAPFEIGNVLGDNCFNCFSDDLLEQEAIEQLINTERQDNLDPKYRQHLGWILLKLFKDGHLEVREKRTDRIFHSFDDPAVGYWKISIDR